MAFIDQSLMVDSFKQKQKDYEKIFGLRMADGFKAKKDFVSLPVDQKFVLTRETLGNVTQPGRTGGLNNPGHSIFAYKQRIAELLPAKVDLLLTEQDLYKMRTSWLSAKESADPSDINSIAGRNYIMGQIFKKIASEVSAAIFRGQLGFGYDNTNATTQATSMFQGGLNLADGFGLKFTRGYATSGTGAVGDIPSVNKVASAATSFTAATAIAELTKLLDIIEAHSHFEEFVYDDDPETPGYNFFIPAAYESAIAKAMEQLVYKPNQLVEPSSDGDGWQYKQYPKLKIKKRRWMQGVSNIFGSPSDNLFYLHQNTEVDIPAIKFYDLPRGIQIVMDWEMAFDYADGRLITLWK